MLFFGMSLLVTTLTREVRYWKSTEPLYFAEEQQIYRLKNNWEMKAEATGERRKDVIPTNRENREEKKSEGEVKK